MLVGTAAGAVGCWAVAYCLLRRVPETNTSTYHSEHLALGRQPARLRCPPLGRRHYHSLLTFGLLLALGLALLGDLTGLLARGVRVGPQ